MYRWKGARVDNRKDLCVRNIMNFVIFTWIRKKVGTVFLPSVERYIDTQRNNEFLGHKSPSHNC